MRQKVKTRTPLDSDRSGISLPRKKSKENDRHDLKRR